MKRLIKLTLPLVAALCVFVASGAVLAGDGHGKKHRMNHYFEKLDTNGDELISRQEQLDAAAKRFDAADANGDGMLSKEEIKQSHMQHRKDRKDRKDKKQHRKEDSSMQEQDS
jgi:hypothetical protein